MLEAGAALLLPLAQFYFHGFGDVFCLFRSLPWTFTGKDKSALHSLKKTISFLVNLSVSCKKKWNKLQTCTPFTNWSSSNWCSWFNQSVPRGLLAHIKLHSQHFRFVSGHPESNSHYSTRFPPSQTGKICVGEVLKHFSDYTACAVFKKQVLQALGSSCLAGRQQGMNS